ncbi:MAG: hypothetical protein J0L64_21835, partial [Acidobacteria bacterium]|nr:hypothetical protein [Acidobacteriota bacterium]
MLGFYLREMGYTGRLLAAAALCAVIAGAQTKRAAAQKPELLTFAELRALADDAVPSGDLGSKLQRLLTTPVIDNSAAEAGAKPVRPEWPGLGPLLRTAMWNIERGQEFDLVRMAFTDGDGLMKEAAKRHEEEKVAMSGNALAEARKQAGWLREADVVVLNEVDWGMTRTDYREVGRELARAAGMNYAFGVEFVEVDKLYLGDEDIDLTDEQK